MHLRSDRRVARDARLSPLCASKPLALPRSVLKASVWEKSNGLVRHRPQLSQLPPLGRPSHLPCPNSSRHAYEPQSWRTLLVRGVEYFLRVEFVESELRSFILIKRQVDA